MPITLGDIRTSPINMQACENTEQEILDILNKSNLNARELILVLAQTIIDVGGTLDNNKGKLTCEEMWRRYATNPTLGSALMAFGADVISEWLQIKQDNS